MIAQGCYCCSLQKSYRNSFPVSLHVRNMYVSMPVGLLIVYVNNVCPYLDGLEGRGKYANLKVEMSR